MKLLDRFKKTREESTGFPEEGRSKFVNKIRSVLSKINFKKIYKNEKIVSFLSSKFFVRIVFALVILIALVQVVFGVMIYRFKSEDKVTRIVAKVLPFPVAIANQNFISYSSYLQEKDYIHHFYKSTQQDKVDFTQIDSQILDQLVENRLISFQASRNGSKVSKKDVDATIQDISDQNGGQDKVEKVLDDLYGLNLNQFRKLVKTQMVREKLDNDLIARVKVQHILVRIDKNAPEDQVAAAKAKIEGYRKEIAEGADFGEAAKKYSEDTGSAAQGGELEPFADGEMVPEFSKVAFETKVGDISDPVRTDFGWHIIKVGSKTGEIQKSFGDWLEGIKKKSLILKFIK